jgi:hypothetical protein
MIPPTIAPAPRARPSLQRIAPAAVKKMLAGPLVVAASRFFTALRS